ncbi:hypothetical protein GCM10010446_24340 [Streptomyces enissocaesilis]|uniref:HTH cro/C1-type domain-containing protein n=1 Tax=Streptomyces enissocaesilis TaxID=332589 RepID=A0ABN3X6E5_9ACTN
MIGERIKQRRGALGWSQPRLASEANRCAGLETLTRQDINRYETGRRSPRTWLPAIALALGVEPAQLTGPDPPEERPGSARTNALPESSRMYARSSPVRFWLTGTWTSPARARARKANRYTSELWP